jgi:3-phenylpropionate/trans-cinnamate dioxygenase ferredoxin subunit
MMSERLEGAARLPCGELQRFEIGERAICVAHVSAGRFLAVSDLCTHEDQSLSEGWLSGCEIECPLHHSIFSLETGEALSLPAEEALETYSVQVDGDDQLIEWASGESE